jgi:hypothetical protein
LFSTRFIPFPPPLLTQTANRENQIPEDSFFAGGEKTEGKFVRLTMEHIAVNFAREGERGEQMTETFLGFVGEEFKKRFEGRGWRYVLFLELEGKAGEANEWVVPQVGV